MGDTAIEWTEKTWNPVTGCSKVSQGCKNCYAERVSQRFGWDFDTVTTHPDRLDQPLKWKKPRMIPVNSMSDLFHHDVPFKFIVRVFSAMALTPRHTYQVLTKRPQQALKFFSCFNSMDESPGSILADEAHRDFGEESDCWISNYVNGWSMPKEIANDGNPCNGTVHRWPLPNVWLGASIENQEAANVRFGYLHAIHRMGWQTFVSYEPALGQVELPLGKWHYECDTCRCSGETPYQPDTLCGNQEDGIEYCRGTLTLGFEPDIDWVIAGGESGPGARPSHPDWFRSVRDQCQAAGVPFFFKQWGEWAPTDILDKPWSLPMKRIDRAGREVTDLRGLHDPSDALMARAGKKKTGRLLDEMEWNEMPGRREIKCKAQLLEQVSRS